MCCEANFCDVAPGTKSGTAICTMLVGTEVTTVELEVVLDARVSGEKAI
jgi:hypothetical protein